MKRVIALVLAFAMLVSVAVVFSSCDAQGIQGEKGEKGDQGEQGIQGEKGDQGNTGATIEKVEFDEQGRLVITLTDGSVLEPVTLPEKEEHVHSFGELMEFGNNQGLTCDQKMYCQICSACLEARLVSGSEASHDYYESYSCDKSYHWYACSKCNSITGKEAHTFYDDSRKCSVCNVVASVETEINAIMETAWWNPVHRKNPIVRSKDAVTGEVTYTWSLSIKAEIGLFSTLPEDHSEYPGAYGISFTTGEGAVVYIKDKNNDTDYTKYNVKPGSWRTERWCDIYFEAEGFIPVGGAKYDMFLVFDLPTMEGATPYPGEKAYVWAPGGYWIYDAPLVIGEPWIDDSLAYAYQCTVQSHSERCDVSWVINNDYTPEDFDPTTFPAMNFSFTVKAEDNLFPTITDADGNRYESFAEINPEGAFACVKGPNDTEFTLYECDYMLTERWCDMWFTLKDFTPEAGVEYEMVFFFLSGISATHPYASHYVYAENWVAGGGSPKA